MIPGIKLADFQNDLKAGSGNELKRKFRAVHSSSALVVNTFARWKNDPHTLRLCEVDGFKGISFEKKCPTGLRGTPPNLDLLVENDTTVIGIESKLLEHLKPKTPKFRESYSRDKLPQCEDTWWNLLEDNKYKGVSQYLDVAQLIKHYLGLRKKYRERSTVLLYLFWEPSNWKEIDACRKHREEIRLLAEQVKGTSVRFTAESYLELWAEWDSQAELAEHLTNLRKRYLLTA